MKINAIKRDTSVVMLDFLKKPNETKISHGGQGPAPFGAGVLLAWEKHEQKDYQMHPLLVAQLQRYCQLKHGESPVFRWQDLPTGLKLAFISRRAGR